MAEGVPGEHCARCHGADGHRLGRSAYGTAVAPIFHLWSPMGVIEDFLDHRSIAVLRHALKFVKEVIVVVVEAHRQPFQDRGRQIGRWHAPLFDGVALEKGLIQVFAHKPHRLVFKGLRILDRRVGLFLGNEGMSLLGAHRAPEELIDKAKKFFYKAESLLQNKEANPANMRKALIRYTLTVEYLDQFSPKPDIWHQAMEKRKKVEAMLEKRRKELVFDYMKNIKMQEYKKCLDVLEELMLISEPGGKQWTKARDFKINIERTIRQRNR